jgi:hypothetical protein
VSCPSLYSLDQTSALLGQSNTAATSCEFDDRNEFACADEGAAAASAAMARQALDGWQWAVRRLTFTTFSHEGRTALRGLAAWYKQICVDETWKHPPPKDGLDALATEERGPGSSVVPVIVAHWAVRVAEELVECRRRGVAGGRDQVSVSIAHAKLDVALQGAMDRLSELGPPDLVQLQDQAQEPLTRYWAATHSGVATGKAAGHGLRPRSPALKQTAQVVSSGARHSRGSLPSPGELNAIHRTDRRELLNTGAAERLLSVLSDDPDGGGPPLTTLCRTTLSLLPVNGVYLVLKSPGSNQGLAGASDATAWALQNLEFTLGEGPGVDAYHEARPVVIDDLQNSYERWPQFVQSAAGLGVGSALALPLQVGAIKLGVFVLYGNQPRTMSAEYLREALQITDLITNLVLALQSEAASESLAWALDVSNCRVVHQATGMISVQLHCGVEEALVRLRGRAFTSGRTIDDVAESVVELVLRFDEE